MDYAHNIIINTHFAIRKPLAGIVGGMKRLLAWLVLAGALALAQAAPVLDYDPRVLLPSGVEQLSLDDCPVPKGFWEPLEEKGWVSVCYLAKGDTAVLKAALELALQKAGYERTVQEEQPLGEGDRFVLEQWRAGERQLFIQFFLFPARSAAVYLISHPPH